MKTKQITELAGTDTIVRIDVADYPSDKWATIRETGVGYWTQSDNWSERGVEVAIVDRDGNPVTHRNSEWGQKTHVVAPRQIVRTLADVERLEAQAKLERAERETAERERRTADDKARRPILADVYARYGSDAVLLLDGDAYDVDRLATLVEILDDATVEILAPNVYRLTVRVTAAYRLHRIESIEEIEQTTFEFLDLDGDLIDLEQGRRSRALGRTSDEQFARIAVLARIA